MFRKQQEAAAAAAEGGNGAAAAAAAAQAAAAQAAAAAADRKKPVPWGTFLRSAPVWAVIVAHFCFNWGYYTLLAWLPSYFEMALGERRRLPALCCVAPAGARRPRVARSRAGQLQAGARRPSLLPAPPSTHARPQA